MGIVAVNGWNFFFFKIFLLNPQPSSVISLLKSGHMITVAPVKQVGTVTMTRWLDPFTEECQQLWGKACKWTLSYERISPLHTSSFSIMSFFSLGITSHPLRQLSSLWCPVVTGHLVIILKLPQPAASLEAHYNLASFPISRTRRGWFLSSAALPHCPSGD